MSFVLRYVDPSGAELRIEATSISKLEGWIRYDSIDTYVIEKNGKLYRVASRGEVTRYK